MRSGKIAQTTAVKILARLVPSVKKRIDGGVETFALVWGERTIGKTTGGMAVAKKYPYAVYLPLNPVNSKSESALVRAMVEALGYPAKWSVTQHLKILTEEVGKKVFIIDNAEFLLQKKGRRPKTPPLLSLLKYLTEIGHGFILLSNEDVPPELVKYPEIWKRVREIYELPVITVEDLKEFGELHGITSSEWDAIYEFCKANFITAIDLDEFFGMLARNKVKELSFEVFSKLWERGENQRLAKVSA
jgi:hypothetical protein